jgi:hypothetical protein
MVGLNWNLVSGSPIQQLLPSGGRGFGIKVENSAPFRMRQVQGMQHRVRKEQQLLLSRGEQQRNVTGRVTRRSQRPNTRHNFFLALH